MAISADANFDANLILRGLETSPITAYSFPRNRKRRHGDVKDNLRTTREVLCEFSGG
jgi:hypothetical protein